MIILKSIENLVLRPNQILVKGNNWSYFGMECQSYTIAWHKKGGLTQDEISWIDSEKLEDSGDFGGYKTSIKWSGRKQGRLVYIVNYGGPNKTHAEYKCETVGIKNTFFLVKLVD
jgi:hypothetical protein